MCRVCVCVCVCVCVSVSVVSVHMSMLPACTCCRLRLTILARHAFVAVYLLSLYLPLTPGPRCVFPCTDMSQCLQNKLSTSSLSLALSSHPSFIRSLSLPPRPPHSLFLNPPSPSLSVCTVFLYCIYSTCTCVLTFSFNNYLCCW